jgi:phage baseplate assembly protein W
MVPGFGVGLYRFLFEGVNSVTFGTIAETINKQVSFYIPSISLENIDFLTSDEDSTLQLNEVRVIIKYTIQPFNEKDELIITSTMTN